MSITSVTILGAGNAGFALACHMSLRGFRVALYEHPDFKQSIQPVVDTGEIVALEEADGFKGIVSGTGRIELATSDIKAAVEFGQLLIIIVPAFGQGPLFEMALPHIKESHIIMSMPGNFASLLYAEIMQRQGATKKLHFIETDSIPYACRKVKDNQVFISGMKQVLHAGVFPSKDTKSVIEAVQPLFPLKLEPCANIIEADLHNMNMILHPPPVLLNVGWMESTGGKFSFYGSGCSPSVCKVMDGMDNERMQVADALGLKSISVLDICKKWYGATDMASTYDYVHYSMKGHAYFPAPATLDNRYINEDLCYIVIPLIKLAKRYGICTNVLEAMVLIAETTTGKKLQALRNFDTVVKDGETVEDMNMRLFEGWVN